VLCRVELNLRFPCLSAEEAIAVGEVAGCVAVSREEGLITFDCPSCDAFKRCALAKSVNGERIRKERPTIERSVKTLDAITARLMVNLARVVRGSKVWEPFLGTGAVAYEVERAGGYVVGGDLDESALRLARRNTSGDIVLWDALNPPLRGRLDAAVGDPPYGRLSTSSIDVRPLLLSFVEVASLHVKKGGYVVFASPVYVDLPFVKSCMMFLHGGLYRVVYVMKV
jgi:tRNA (guanine10-N2)-dimethyltransferase